jgi:hypothetical protein
MRPARLLPRLMPALSRLMPGLALLGALFGWNSPSEAYVLQIIIDQTNTANYNPIPVGSSTPGPSVSYTIYTGRIVGALAPTNPLNAVITDINLAPTNGGLVNYTAVFSIVTPTNPAARSGLMIHEVPNRGGNAINTNALIAGATYVQSGWQPDLLAQCSSAPVPPYPCVSLNSPYGVPSGSYPFFTAPSGFADFVVQVPVATVDGNPPNGTNTITGQVYGHVCVGPNGCPLAVGTVTSTSHMAIQGPAFVPYQPVSTDTNQAKLWTTPSQTFTGETGPKTFIPSAQWAWAYCPTGWPGTPNPNYICLNGQTFDPNLLYEVVYTAADPLVLGVGFAAFRDLGSFLRYGTTAPGGGSNPIAGAISTTMTVGASQSAAFIHGLIFYGFNEDEDGRIVFDGAWPEIDGRMMVMNIRWGQPNNLMYLYMGGDEAPVWWADYPNFARNLPPNGMLHRCRATGTCPQVLETFGSAEMYSEKMHVSLCGFTCVTDIPLPPNVYRYYSPGATHGGGKVSFTWSPPGSITPPTGQTYPSDPIPLTYTNNALQAAFINWLMNGTPMPPSAPGVTYPSLESGQLVPDVAAYIGFPTIPGFPFAGDQAWPPFIYDFGPQENYANQSGIPTIQPPKIQYVLPVFTPTVDADGNETQVGGIPSVLGQAPIGTYVGWNLTSIGWYTGQVIPGAGGSGGFWPFWDTMANRIANGDPRLSLEERYGTHLGYVCVVTQAANKAIEQRFLLPSDAPGLINLASASNVLTSLTPSTSDTSLANTLCPAKTHDFNGDGKSDVLWRDNSGNVAIWEMNGTQIINSSATFVGGVPYPLWTIIGTGDFNGDGYADILWRDTNGNIAIWEMNGTQIINLNATFVANVSGWSAVGVGDFNGDGMADILWTDGSGNYSIWEMNGVSILNSSTSYLAYVTTNWNVVGVGDFNGDHRSDILWEDQFGDYAIWEMNGTQVINSGATLVSTVATSWTVLRIGDFNGDGESDILWGDQNGNYAIWEMNGTQIVNSGATFLATVGGWSVIGTGDYNGDGNSDILWTDGGGNYLIWEMSGTTVLNSGATYVSLVSTNWTVQLPLGQ